MSVYFVFTNIIWRCLKISSKDLQINGDIRDREIRLIGSDGSQIGIVSSYQALERAEAEGLDLVKISPGANPPVCKIMNYGKFKFEQSKKEKEARKNQHTVDVKEIRLSVNIDQHDLDTKAERAKKFLQKGDKVKVSVRLRGRERSRPELGKATISRFATACSEDAVIESAPKLDDRNINIMMFLAPKSSSAKVKPSIVNKPLENENNSGNKVKE